MDFYKILENNWKLILSAFGVLILSGGAITYFSNHSMQKEKLAQENYYLIEKKLFELKTKKATPVEAKEEKPVAVDFTQVKKDLEKVIADYPNSVAAQMAALHLAGLFVDDKNHEQALAVLQKAQNQNKGLVNTLIQQQIGQLLADQNKCPEAIAIWQKLMDRKEAEFIHDETLIQQALCYTKTNDLKKAEEILTNLANKSTNSQVGNSTAAREAEKYLRLLMFKKASGT